MAQEPEEKELETLLRDFAVKQPPKGLLDNFEKNVWEKINQGPEPLDWKFALLLGVASVGLITAVFIWGIMPLVKRSTPDSINPQVIQREIQRLQADQDTGAVAVSVVREIEAEPVAVTPPPAAVLNEEEVFTEISEDLFILQMLGEDAGMLEDYDLLENDIQTLSQMETRAARAL